LVPRRQTGKFSVAHRRAISALHDDPSRPAAETADERGGKRGSFVGAGWSAPRLFVDTQWHAAAVDFGYGIGQASPTDAGWRVAIAGLVAQIDQAVTSSDR